MMPGAGQSGASDANAAALQVLTAVEPGAGLPPAMAASRGAPAPPWPDPDQSGQNGARAEPTVFAAALDPRTASLVRLETDSHKGSGFYVKPRLVATTADLVGSA